MSIVFSRNLYFFSKKLDIFKNNTIIESERGDEIMNEVFIKRLQTSMEQSKINQSELAELSGISKQRISGYIKGEYEPKSKPIYALAKALGVSASWLMGLNEDDTSGTPSPDPNAELYAKYPNIKPIATRKIPLLGEISCGKPIFVDEERESYVEVGTDIKADFCMRAHGDSMINARIIDGDIVFIRKQNMVNDGEIAAVVIEDEATLKRVYYDRENNVLQLLAENPKYRPLVYSGEELNGIRILGKAVAFESGL